MAAILPQGKTQFFDANGNPLTGGSVTFYAKGTTTYQNTYQDSALSILNANPVVLDSAGFALIWGSGSYTTIVKDQFGNQIYQADTSDGGAPPQPSAANELSYIRVNSTGTAYESRTPAQVLTDIAAVGRLVNVQIFTASGTYTPTTGTNSIIVEGVGGGAGGGGCAAAGSGVASAGGGGSGAYGKARITSGFSGITVTIGAAGAGVNSNAGNAGGTTSFGSLLTLTGGAGGGGGAGSTVAYVSAPPGSNGTATGSMFAEATAPATSGLILSGSSAIAGRGGCNPIGEGGGATAGNAPVASAGKNALGYGAGGGGSIGIQTSGTTAGGNGYQGIIIIYEFA